MLLVGNHSGGNVTPDTLVFTLAFATYFGVERRFFQLAHNLVLSMPGPRHAAQVRHRRGDPENAARRSRPAPRCSSTRAATTRCTARAGTRRRSTSTAARAGSGWRSTTTCRSSRRVDRRPGDRAVPLARRAPREAAAARQDVPPQGAADLARVPWGLNVGDMFGHLPLPAKITVRALDPIDLERGFGEDPDLDEVYDEILGRMQRTLDHAPGRAPLPRDRLRRCGSSARSIDRRPPRGGLGRDHRPRGYTELHGGSALRRSRRATTSTERGLGARYSMRMHVGLGRGRRAVEVVEYDAPRDMAWTSITGIDHRGRWRLREQDDGSTKVTLRLSYGSPGRMLGSSPTASSAPRWRGNLRSTLERLKAEIEGDDDGGVT